MDFDIRLYDKKTCDDVTISGMSFLRTILNIDNKRIMKGKIKKIWTI